MSQSTTGPAATHIVPCKVEVEAAATKTQAPRHNHVPIPSSIHNAFGERIGRQWIVTKVATASERAAQLPDGTEVYRSNEHRRRFRHHSDPQCFPQSRYDRYSRYHQSSRRIKPRRLRPEHQRQRLALAD